MPRFIFERNHSEGWDIYDTKGTGRMNAIGWCDDEHRSMFEEAFAAMDDADRMIAEIEGSIVQAERGNAPQH